MDRHGQIIVLVANVASLSLVQTLINTVTGNVHYVYVGCEDYRILDTKWNTD